ncbi:MAG: TrkA C-terminal domain-containing protein [Acidobacteriota bacterium]
MRRPRLLDTVVLGVVDALSAQAFIWLLRVAQGWLAGYRPPGLPGERRIDVELIAVFREGEVLLPSGKGHLKAGDELLLMTSQDAVKALALHLTPARQRPSVDAGGYLTRGDRRAHH